MALSLVQRSAAVAGRLFVFVTVVCLLVCAQPAVAIEQGLPFQQEMAAVITSPGGGSAVNGSVQILGSAVHPEFQRYELYYTVEPGESWIFIGDAHTTPVSNGFLGSWETAGLPDGNYSLRLRVVRADGNYDEAFARNVVVANTTPPTDTPTPTPETPTPELTPETPVPADIPTSVPVQEATPTPAPIDSVVTPTPAATPTPVTVEQPNIPTPTPRPSGAVEDNPTAAAVANNDTGGNNSSGPSLGDVVEGSSLGSSFMRGAGLAASIFAAVGIFFGIRRLLTWLWYRFTP
ncbi:MAG: hypothetical protein WAZ19_11080 [Anaerolineae bacterium]